MRKEDKLNITKDKLLDATVNLMKSCDNPEKVTSRAIADEAGVPLGMVNYCFGSREGLLYQAFCKDKDTYLKDPAFVEAFTSDLPAKERIRKLHYVVADFLVDEYKYTRAITGYILLNRDLSMGLQTLHLVKEHYGNAKEEWELKLISYELSSMMQLILYRINDMSDFLGKDIAQKEELHRLIDLQIDLLLKE